MAFILLYPYDGFVSRVYVDGELMGRECLAAICYVGETSDLSIKAMTAIASIEGWRHRKWCAEPRNLSDPRGRGAPQS
jgi:hypothetical protein